MVVQYQCSRAGSAVVCRHQLGSNVVRKVFPRVNLLLVIVNLILRNVLEAKHVRKLISFFLSQEFQQRRICKGANATTVQKLGGRLTEDHQERVATKAV